MNFNKKRQQITDKVAQMLPITEGADNTEVEASLKDLGYAADEQSSQTEKEAACQTLFLWEIPHTSSNRFFFLCEIFHTETKLLFVA